MEIEIASLKHIKYCKIISETITDSAKVRGTGIALRTPEYIETKIRNKNAIIATDGSKFAGFCYIEIWGHGKYVAHSGLIVFPDYRGIGLAKKIKKKTFEYSKEKYPLFFTSALRIYALHEISNRLKIDSFIHFDNDVVLFVYYRDLYSIPFLDYLVY